MARYVRAFVVEDIVAVHAAYQQVIRHARQLGPRGRGTVSLLEASYRKFNSELDALAVLTAHDASTKIKARLQKSARRPDTGVAPHLRNAIRSAPLRTPGPFATGAVGVADLDKLEKVVNPHDPQRVPYWIVQEEGTSANVGRVIFGYFFDRGFANAQRPAPGYTGSPRAQPVFLTGRLGNMPGSVRGGIGPRGGKGGKGTIRRPIPARHFVRDGADSARNNWKAGINRIERDSLQDIRVALGVGTRTQARRTATRLRGRRR